MNRVINHFTSHSVWYKQDFQAANTTQQLINRIASAMGDDGACISPPYAVYLRWNDTIFEQWEYREALEILRNRKISTDLLTLNGLFTNNLRAIEQDIIESERLRDMFDQMSIGMEDLVDSSPEWNRLENERSRMDW